ncbi:Sec-independent protein translocase protein TatB [Chitinimonas sp. BJYL2]|uniref:Sec-independent protein translocase protein TatB n=1 Tax=Chitinimonas sp. BJYL2 TaxID=2976696 RepID=UPI0022B3E6D8|nr:Sec-independent protein translocase protein TatB [Chitinimonas sp. BJYL2]
MFDFSFGELLVVGAVALVVIGPERLPKVARTLGAMVARLKRYVAGVQADIQREIDIDNLRQFEAEMKATGRQLHSELSQQLDPVEQDLRNSLQDADEALSAPAPETASPATEAPPVADQPQFDLFAGPASPHKPRPARDRR